MARRTRRRVTRYRFTSARRRALRKAQLISARRRRGKSMSRKRKAAYVAAGVAMTAVAGTVIHNRITRQTLYHNTSAKNAKKIMDQGFKGHQKKAWDVGGQGAAEGSVYFSNVRRGFASQGNWGTVQLKVRVPRKHVSRGWRQPPKAYREKWFLVDEKNLTGVKVKQIKSKPMRGRRLRAARRYTARQREYER